MAAESEQVFTIPDDLDELFEHGGVEELPPGSLVRFSHDSDFLWSISTTANVSHVLAAGAMELGQPVISSAVEDYSIRDTWRRLDASARMIGAIATDDDAVRAGRRIRDVHVHHDIKGVDAEGRVRRAVEPDVYALGWLPIVWIMEQSMLDAGATQERMERWYQETRVAYQCQGVDDAFVPDDYESYRARISEIMKSAQRTESIERLDKAGVEGPKLVPEVLWKGPLKHAGDRFARMMMIGGSPRELLEALELDELTGAQRRVYDAARAASNAWAQKGVRHLRHHPQMADTIHPLNGRRDQLVHQLGHWINRQVVG